MSSEKIKLGLVDDHTLMRKGLVNLIEAFGNCTIVFEANNGEDLFQKLHTHPLPDIVLMDIHMPGMNGYEATEKLAKIYPKIKVLVLTVIDHESAVIRIMKKGARGYLLKDSNPHELQRAIIEIHQKGYFLNDIVGNKLINNLRELSEPEEGYALLTDREIEFLQHCCTDLSYREIAEKMCVSFRTVDGYRESCSEKLQVKSRIGFVTYAIKEGLVQI
jgi:DNA-binding NarL/FixJ family response regulator